MALSNENSLYTLKESALELFGVIERYTMIINQEAISIAKNLFVEITFKDQPEDLKYLSSLSKLCWKLWSAA